MKLDYVEVCGFRGFREKVRVDFGRGFTVITGRNGVGKSTLCDAVEFAILGEIAKYTVESASKESVRDYIWWRGDGSPASHYVTASFVDRDGKTFSITRTRDGGADKKPSEIENQLCQGAAPDDPLRQLCKTSVIRDEWIASLSLDLSETQRFDLVRAALGSVEGADLAAKAKAVVTLAEAACGRVEESYQQARSILQGGLVQLSEANDAANRSGDISTAMAVLDRVIPPTGGELAQRIDLAQRTLPDRRRRLEGLGIAAFEGHEIAAHQRALDSSDEVARREEANAALETARSNFDRLKAELELAQRAYDVEARANEIAASLSILVEHGEALGLHDEHCPLCAATRTNAEFAAGIQSARARIDQLAEGVNSARDNLASARQAASRAEQQVAEAQAAWDAIEQQLRALRSREEAHIEIFERYGLDPTNAANPSALDREALDEREQLVELERALNALEASRAVEALTSVDARVSLLRRQADAAADELARAQSAVAAAKSLEKSVRRSAGEIVDERLARISPLLNEIYQRLRPHANWRSIDYSIRGDVRRFLSLKVGDDLNPQFVFSSGQRRAAGLAFLLSVHLARPWSRWETLMLDDPVQHIDDFRALQLVEVLSSFRQAGRQVVVAVEDEALADLLCRRMLSTPEQGGRRYTIDFNERGAANVTARLDVPPMAPGILRQFDSVQATA
ncbi:chromosome segregation protein SMC [Bradyrhizobium sp. CCBAU 51745]|uniref:AAA family ATPase n=1 Tax=Bradyrhizobium sp. CCBAU 51745 TaxID=1325099 RepID=UPI0023057E5E|nr:AAA family ATPase [Bradyrhizobium sp. CCBAU 51745]MDA9442962.1 chromosome segregation protein SMC [Bradyrhizobium sp. CCBAU 51745]